MDYYRFFKELRQGFLAPVYLLYGEETYLVKEVVKILLGQVEESGLQDFNFDYLDGGEVDFSLVEGAAETLPFGQSHRLVVVKNAPYFGGKKAGKEIQDRIVQLVTGLPETTRLVFSTGGKVDKRLRGVQVIKKMGRVWEFPLVSGNDLVKWVVVRAKKKGVIIAPDTARLLTNSWVYGLERLDQELEKLAAYVGPGGEITKGEIALLVSTETSEKVFALLDAVGSCDTRRALKLAQQMLLAGEAPLLLLFLLAQRLRLLGAARALAQEGLKGKEVALRLKQHPFVVEKALEQAGNFSDGRLQKSLEECLRADGELKGGGLAPSMVLELLIIKLTTESGA